MKDKANSYFDGGLLEFLMWKILGIIITTITFGICLPWAVCMMLEWETRHTVVDGQRLYFDGKATQLFGNWIKWLILSIITLGVYGFWIQIKMKQWVTKHTHVMSEEN